MGNKLKNYIGIAIFFMVGWGISGLIGGDGFFGGIGKQIDAIGSIVSIIIKVATVIGVIWLFSEMFKKNEDKDKSS